MEKAGSKLEDSGHCDHPRGKDISPVSHICVYHEEALRFGRQGETPRHMPFLKEAKRQKLKMILEASGRQREQSKD